MNKATLVIVWLPQDGRWSEGYSCCSQAFEVPVPVYPVIGISLEDLKNINPYNMVPTCT